MIYEPLSLSCGGVVFNTAASSPQFTDTGALCIGIGGIGAEVLCALKKKIHQKLEPDNAGGGLPRYDGIQLLAIDSDEHTLSQIRRDGGLSDQEIFSTHMPNLCDFIRSPHGKMQIRQNPLLDWMEIDEIDALMAPCGAGGNRQVGRFLLMRKANELFAAIRSKLHTLATSRGTGAIDVYLFAGLAGGTGGGCFADICYLIQRAAEMHGMDISIIGYFFAPDVAPGMLYGAAAAHYDSNGYAALKELDYLLNLRDNHDRFEQNYGNGLFISSQYAPVDLCYLISSVRADGTMIMDAHRYAVDLASDSVIQYLADVNQNWNPLGPHPETIRGHMHKIGNGVAGLPRRWGANQRYSVLGASVAEVPTTQINTYLAAGFFRRFEQTVGRRRNSVTQRDVGQVVERLHLRPEDIFWAILDGIPELELTKLSLKELIAMPVAPKGRLNSDWTNSSNNWMTACQGRIQCNAGALSKPLADFTYQNADDSSLIGRVFRYLCNVCLDPEYGPYFAVDLLYNHVYNLNNAVEMAVRMAENQMRSLRCEVGNIQDWVAQLNEEIVHRVFSRRKAYEEYRPAVLDWQRIQMHIIAMNSVIEVLMNLRVQINELYCDFFGPLANMLLNLRETFALNEDFLKNHPQVMAPNARQIVDINDLRPRLDQTVANLTQVELIPGFADWLLRNSSDWRSGDPDRIAQCVRAYMMNLFQGEATRSMEDYLYEKDPALNGDFTRLSAFVDGTVLPMSYDLALPLFAVDPSYLYEGPACAYKSVTLTVPNSCSAICNGARRFVQFHDNCTLRESGIGDQIIVSRDFSGLPLFSWYSLRLMKAAYDAHCAAGTHLYADTGRGGSRRNWKTWLPDPVPYSRREGPRNDLAEILDLYHAARESDVIRIQYDHMGGYKYYVVPTAEQVIPEYRKEDFLENGIFSASRCEAAIEHVTQLYNTWRDEFLGFGQLFICNGYDPRLGGNGDDILIDYFVGSPVLQQVVRKELDKCSAFKNALNSLENILREAVGN